MSRLPRLAIGTVQPDTVIHEVIWGLMSALTRRGSQVQHFHSRCCFGGVEGALEATGNTSRHLDSWLMDRQLCRELFERGSRDSDLSIVEGCRPVVNPADGAELCTLCKWLEAPRVCVLDVTTLRDCRVPTKPDVNSNLVDGILLDRVADSEDFIRWQTTLESLWSVQVIGGLEELPTLRAKIRAMQPGSAISAEMCETLANSFERFSDFDAILRIADRHEWTPTAGERPLADACDALCGQGVTVAVAYDEAFHCHFPDTLDALEVVGATVVDFSPLQDEALPPNVDLVYLGCGRTDLHATRLAENHCLRSALHKHVCSGGRVYAEGGGLAYLCQSLDTPDGHTLPMCGVLPATATLASPFTSLERTEITLIEPSWLGKTETKLRGYRNPNWRITPLGTLTNLTEGFDGQPGIVRHRNVVGSCVHINFATQLHLLRSLIDRETTASR
jgi:cobyrinic acid a,c-diamide synthase